MSIRVYTHSACLGHDTGPQHPECPQRLTAVLEVLRELPDLDWHEAPRATRGQLLRVHSQAHLDSVLETTASAPHLLDPDTVVSPGSPEAALRASGAGIAAVDAVLAGETSAAFCAVRPPGHHATGGEAMGFCLLNNVAVAAAHALEHHGLARVAIADFDVHHGNGTQAIFQADPRVLYLSSHQCPLFPHSGNRSERGVGNLVNIPLPPDTGSDAFRDAWSTRMLPEMDAFAPQLVLVSAGFDGHWRDPLAQWQLEAADFAWLTVQLLGVARRHASGRIVSTLEGGYDLQALRECVPAHVGALSPP